MRPIAPVLLALVLGGCPSLVTPITLDDDTDATEDPAGRDRGDDKPRRDTADTFVPFDPTPPGDSDVEEPVDTGTFLPHNVSYGAEFAIDTSGRIGPYMLGTSALPPHLWIELSDGVRSCVVYYTLDASASGYVGGPGTPAALASFLQARGLQFGFVVEDPDYTAITDGACSALPAGFYTTDLASELLGLFQTTGPVMLGLTTSVDPTFYQTALQASNIPIRHWLGGQLRMPFNFRNIHGITADAIEVGAIVGEVDAAYRVLANAQGNMLLMDASDAWSGGKPAVGFYRVLSPYGFTLTP